MGRWPALARLMFLAGGVAATAHDVGSFRFALAPRAAIIAALFRLAVAAGMSAFLIGRHDRFSP